MRWIRARERFRKPGGGPRTRVLTISWLLRFMRLGLRYDRTERTTATHPACTIINVRRLIKSGF